MTLTAPATPWLAKVPLGADGQTHALLIVHADQALAPTPALRQVVEFEDNGQGGFISAAQALDGRWGYIDAQGRWLIAPTLDNARGFSDDGLARFCRDGRWGYIDLLAQEVIAPQFEDARPLRNGLAAVKVGPQGWRIIDRQGRFTCEACFHQLDNFGAVGLALAEQWDPRSHQRLRGYVDHQGQWVIAARFAQARAFDDHAVTAASVDGETWGLIDAEGAWVLRPCYPCIEAFNSEGLAYYDEPDSWNNGHGYLNTRGKVVVKGGRHLSRNMACGLAADSDDGTRFVDAHGKLLQGPALSYASDFRAETECAVARLATDHRPHPHPQQREPAAGAWGLLHTSGRWVPAAPGLLEPLTDGDGWIPNTLPDTPLVPFLTTDGHLAWMDKEGQVVWRAKYEATQVSLRDAQGHTLWCSGPLPHCSAPRPFFHRPASDQLEQIACVDDVVDYAQALATDAEERLHQLAQGLPTCRATGTPDADGEEDGGEDNDPHAADQRHTVVVRRVARAYLSEEHNGPYAFMSEGLAQAVAQLRQALHKRLQAHWGPADPDPEHAAPWQHSGTPMAAWSLPLRQPLVADTPDKLVCVPEANTLWLSLYPQADTGDGDAWWELWLMAAPSVDALQAAQHTRDARRPMAAPNPHVPSAEETPPANSPPTTREAWQRAVQQDPSAIGHVPAAWLDDALLDEALAAAPKVLGDIPPAWHTPERLQAVVSLGLAQAREIPPHCMTRDALLLARERYAGDPDWDGHDERCSQVPSITPNRWDHNSLYGLWGCLLTPALALHAVQSGAPLRDVPHWLRTDALEHTALQADIYNISYIGADKITPALAQRAVQHDYGRLITHVPLALLTPALCLASARANGLTLQDIPEPLRGTEVCVAALEDRHDVFHHVPPRLAVEVTTRLIDNDLARARKQGEPRHSSHWHVQRAWAHLWNQQPAQALEDALRGLPHARYPQHAHYVLASAYRALGHTRQAALEASTVLSLQSPYTAEWDAHEDTTWLAPLAREHMQAADEATLVQQLQSHPRTLADVPRARITHAMVDAALQADESAVCFVPKRLMTPARYAAALRQHVKTLEQIPAPMLSEEACADHVHEAGWRLADVPTPWRTVAVCAVAIHASAGALLHVPARLQPQVLQAAQALAVQAVSDSQEQGAIAQRLAEQLAGQWQALQRTPGMPWMQRARRQGGWVALLAGSMVLTPSSQTATRGGLVGFAQQRPVLALLLHLLGGTCALVGHAFVSVGAWRAEGAWAGLASFTLLGFSELYWAWRFVWTEPARPLLGTTAAFVATYVLCWWPLYRKAGRAQGYPRQISS